VLRGYGYIVWKENSEWLLGDADLKQGEVRLTYSRGPGPTDPVNLK
jgi:hypothetical protein